MITQAYSRLTAQLFKVHFKVLKRDAEARLVDCAPSSPATC